MQNIFKAEREVFINNGFGIEIYQWAKQKRKATTQTCKLWVRNIKSLLQKEQVKQINGDQ